MSAPTSRAQDRDINRSTPFLELIMFSTPEAFWHSEVAYHQQKVAAAFPGEAARLIGRRWPARRPGHWVRRRRPLRLPRPASARETTVTSAATSAATAAVTSPATSTGLVTGPTTIRVA
jgi:hypothetical protein